MQVSASPLSDSPGFAQLAAITRPAISSTLTLQPLPNGVAYVSRVWLCLVTIR